MAKTKDQRKGIFCLEGAMVGVSRTRRQSSPCCDFWKTLSGCKRVVPPLRCLQTREEFDFYLRKWRGASFNNFPNPVSRFPWFLKVRFFVGEGRGASLSLEDLAERLDGGCKGRVVSSRVVRHGLACMALS